MLEKCGRRTEEVKVVAGVGEGGEERVGEREWGR